MPSTHRFIFPYTAKSLYGLFYISWDAGRFREVLAFAHGAALEGATAGDRELESTALSGVFTIHYELGDLDGAEKAADAARALDVGQDRAYI